MSDVGHMDPDLVSAAGFQLTHYLCRNIAKCFSHAKAGDSVTAAVKQNGLLLTVSFVPGELRCHFDCRSFLETDAKDAAKSRIAPVGNPVAKRAIGAFHRVRSELVGKAVVRCVRLCDDKQAAGFLVDPMDDARSFGTADAGKTTAKMMQKRVDQRAVCRSRRRVDHHAGGFVYDNQIVVIENDVQGDVFGCGVYFDGFCNSNFEFVAFGHARFGVSHGQPSFGDSTFR